MLNNDAKGLIPLTNIWLDNMEVTFSHAFIERQAYEWMIEIVNPLPIPLIENKEYVAQISFDQSDGMSYESVDIQYFDMEKGEEFTTYRFFFYPQEG
ncbi:hypothetical protein [Halobacillus seohaensis]|uniref:Uncharacterized protein n=1 Tax=Halobacillus seohaensis TaxID=447421 RepID=A0ABW2EM79_9BACI